MIEIREIQPVTDALIQSALPDADYHDAHEVKITSGRFTTIEEFARAYFLAQPAWLRTISMNQPSRAKLERTVNIAKFEPGESIGSWRIYMRNADEIVFGESLGFMTYRFSLRLKRGTDTDTIIASTVAKMNNPLGKMYFAIVRLVHKRFVRLSLANALSTTTRP
jgi:hypothetical protein